MSIIEKALKRYRAISYSNRYGGRVEDYKLAQQALAVFNQEETNMDLDLNISVTIGGKDVSVGELLAIDETDLSSEYAAQAARFAYVCVLKAQAKREWGEAERIRKEDEAKAFVDYKSDPEQIPEGSKTVTDGFAKQLVDSDERVNELRQHEIEAEYGYRVLEALSDALGQRAQMLISLGADLRQEMDQTSMHLNESADERLKERLMRRKAR